MFEEQIKAVKHIQNMAGETEAIHADIDRGIEDLKRSLMSLDAFDEDEYQSALERERSILRKAIPLECKTFHTRQNKVYSTK